MYTCHCITFGLLQQVYTWYSVVVVVRIINVWNPVAVRVVISFLAVWNTISIIVSIQVIRYTISVVVRIQVVWYAVAVGVLEPRVGGGRSHGGRRGPLRLRGLLDSDGRRGPRRLESHAGLAADV